MDHALSLVDRPADADRARDSPGHRQHHLQISVLAGRLPPDKRNRARVLGLGLAMISRILLLLSLTWVMRLKTTLFEVFSREFSGRDLILIAGGLFLLAKSTREIHHSLMGPEGHLTAKASGRMASVLAQIAVLDIVFSLDSVITAIVIAVGVMMLSAKPIGIFVDTHPTIKMLALSFLLLIGLSLVADGLDFHIPKGYIYFAMSFSVGVGNSFMVNLLKTNALAIGATADQAHFDATIGRTNAQLQNDTANISVVSASINQDALSLVLGVQNMVGRKFPSGIPARRCWLHVVIKDSRGRLVFESGKPQGDGSITGNNADLNSASYEPHYDLITSSDQVQIYEPIMLDSDGSVTYTLLRAASYAKDNRLLPSGFYKATAPQDIAVWGEAANDSNFTAGSDQVTYQVNVSGKRSGHLP